MTEANETVIAGDQEQQKQELTQEEQSFVDSASNSSELDSYLNLYVGEGKKYKTVADLAKAYANADVFIETLKREKREVEEELQAEREKFKSLADVLDVFGKKEVVEKPKQESTPKQTEQNLEEVVRQVLAKEAQQQEVVKKKQETKQRLLEAFGSEDKAAEKINSFIKDNPNKKSVVEILATTDPDALIKLLKDEEGNTQPTQQKQVTPTLGGKSASAGTNTSGVLPITWSEARRIRKENPSYYKTHKFQKMLHEAALVAQKQGIDFYRT
jgi:hypothetical protein